MHFLFHIFLFSEEAALTAKTKEVASCLPSLEISEKNMYRARSSVRPPLPLNKSDINLTDLWRKTKNGDDFLLVDDGEGENRMLVCIIENLIYSSLLSYSKIYF